jgi:hypothetical protein
VTTTDSPLSTRTAECLRSFSPFAVPTPCSTNSSVRPGLATVVTEPPAGTLICATSRPRSWKWPRVQYHRRVIARLRIGELAAVHFFPDRLVAVDVVLLAVGVEPGEDAVLELALVEQLARRAVELVEAHVTAAACARGLQQQRLRVAHAFLLVVGAFAEIAELTRLLHAAAIEAELAAQYVAHLVEVVPVARSEEIVGRDRDREIEVVDRVRLALQQCDEADAAGPVFGLAARRSGFTMGDLHDGSPDAIDSKALDTSSAKTDCRTILADIQPVCLPVRRRSPVDSRSMRRRSRIVRADGYAPLRVASATLFLLDFDTVDFGASPRAGNGRLTQL